MDSTEVKFQAVLGEVSRFQATGRTDRQGNPPVICKTNFDSCWQM